MGMQYVVLTRSEKIQSDVCLDDDGTVQIDKDQAQVFSMAEAERVADLFGGSIMLYDNLFPEDDLWGDE